jgi:hypothetical protein
MKQGPSRRQWFLGLVGAVFGTGAARAVDRLLPGVKSQSSEASQLCLTCIYRDETGVYHSSSKPLAGSVTVATDAQTGNVLIEVRDSQGRLIQQTCHPNVSVYVHRGPAHSPGTPGVSYSTYLGGSGSYDTFGPSTYWHGGAVTYTYDANGDKLSDQA